MLRECSKELGFFVGRVFLAALFSAGIVQSAAHAAGCPSFYDLMDVGRSDGVKECRPALPSSDFYRGQDYFPVCGKKRVPVSKGSHMVFDIASSGTPRANTPIQYLGQSYKYAQLVSAQPRYYYDGLECACASRDYPSIPVVGASSGSASQVNGVTLFPPDDFDSINMDKPGVYAAVAIAKDGSSNGRDGGVFSSGRSYCGCPNFNEVVTDTGSGAAYPSGLACSPIYSGPNLVLAHYQDSMASMVASNEQTSSVTGNYITTISLPKTGGGFSTYHRRIWLCESPFSASGGQCAFVSNQHACDAGNGTSVPASPVSAGVTGMTDPERFRNAMNKKFACCTNEFSAGDPYTKFDCIDNSMQSTSFDDLWSSADATRDGGQLYAFILAGTSGAPISGFYTLAGERCDQYSEFAGEIETGVVKASGSNPIQVKGSIPLPSGSGAFAYAEIKAGVVANGKGVPTTASERRRCPILVRTALMAHCPAPTAPPEIQKTHVEAGGTRRCAAAETLEVHLQIRQIWELEAQSILPTVDSIIDRKFAGKMSVRQILESKNGTACPPGTVRNSSNGNCVY